MKAYTSIIKTNINFILISNKNKISLLISKNFRLRRMYNLYKNNLVNSYLTSFKDFHLVKDPFYQK